MSWPAGDHDQECHHRDTGKHQAVGGRQNGSSSCDWAAVLQVTTKRHVKKSGTDAKPRQQGTGEHNIPGRLPVQEISRREKQQDAKDRHPNGAPRHQTQFDSVSRSDPCQYAADSDAQQQRDQQRRPFGLRDAATLLGEYVNVQLGERGDRPEEDDTHRDTKQCSAFKQAGDVGHIFSGEVDRKFSGRTSSR